MGGPWTCEEGSKSLLFFFNIAGVLFSPSAEPTVEKLTSRHRDGVSRLYVDFIHLSTKIVTWSRGFFIKNKKSNNLKEKLILFFFFILI